MRVANLDFAIILGDVGMVHKTGKISLDFRKLRAMNGNQPVLMTRKMWRLLAILISFGNNVVSRDTIMKLVFDLNNSTRSCDTFVALLRKNLGNCITTHYGQGYSWTPEP